MLAGSILPWAIAWQAAMLCCRQCVCIFPVWTSSQRLVGRHCSPPRANSVWVCTVSVWRLFHALPTWCLLIRPLQFKALDFQRIYDSMQKPAFVFDGRNILDHDRLRAIGFVVSVWLTHQVPALALQITPQRSCKMLLRVW